MKLFFLVHSLTFTPYFLALYYQRIARYSLKFIFAFQFIKLCSMSQVHFHAFQGHPDQLFLG